MSKFIRILTIDGGGMRGIIPGEVLVTLETKLQRISKNPFARIADFFDLIAGTSTGGILTSLYLCPDRKQPHKARYSAEKVSDFLLNEGRNIFNISLWQKIRSLNGLTDERYPVEPLEEVLFRYLGRVKLSELIKPCLITAYDMQHRKAFFFTQHTAKKNPDLDFLVREVARATSAAPAFFQIAKIKSLKKTPHAFIDGGVFSSNPALCAYAEAHRFPLKLTARNMLFLSLGTGQTISPYDTAQINHWGVIDWLYPLLDIFISGVSETVDYQMRQIFAAEKVPNQYLRINPPLGSDCSPDLDNASKVNLNQLKASSERTIRMHENQLERMAEMLVRSG